MMFFSYQGSSQSASHRRRKMDFNGPILPNPVKAVSRYWPHDLDRVFESTSQFLWKHIFRTKQDTFVFIQFMLCQYYWRQNVYIFNLALVMLIIPYCTIPAYNNCTRHWLGCTSVQSPHYLLEVYVLYFLIHYIFRLLLLLSYLLYADMYFYLRESSPDNLSAIHFRHALSHSRISLYLISSSNFYYRRFGNKNITKKIDHFDEVRYNENMRFHRHWCLAHENCL